LSGYFNAYNSAQRIGSNGKTGMPGATGTPGTAGSTGDGGNGGLAGFGGGLGSGDGGRGGGGLGAGGDIFVEQGGVLTVDGGLLTGGSVAGGAGANPGLAAGAGIFLQGDETITLSAPAGSPLNVADPITDEKAAGGTSGTGGLQIAGTGTVLLGAKNSFGGGIALQSGTLGLAHTGAAGSGAIGFGAGAGATLEFAVTTAPANSIDGFAPGDAIVIDGLVATSHGYTGGKLTVSGTAGGVSLTLPGDFTTGSFSIVTDAVADDTTITVACFAAGTRLATPDGDAAVEDLRPGDRVLTHTGAVKPIIWVGRRHIDLNGHPDPETSRPIRIAACAFAEGIPSRDLFLSPDHAVFIDGILIPIKLLENGSTIRQASPNAVTYVHVELADHGIVLAESLAAESYLDTGNRGMFDNARSPRYAA
jgi:hypothetical protein